MLERQAPDLEAKVQGPHLPQFVTISSQGKPREGSRISNKRRHSFVRNTHILVEGRRHEILQGAEEQIIWNKHVYFPFSTCQQLAQAPALSQQTHEHPEELAAHKWLITYQNNPQFLWVSREKPCNNTAKNHPQAEDLGLTGF